MFEFIFNLAISCISQTGYLGVCFLMILESMIFPIPSEAVMPFAGFLIGSKFSWQGVLFASSLGSIIGSSLSYFIGLYGGRPFLEKFGKFFLLDKHHLELSEKFFEKYGDKAILISRFIPVIRHFISIPAGVCKMNFLKFSIYTLIGASCWNMFLAYLGFALQENWTQISKYTHYIDYLIVFLLLIALIYFIKTIYKTKNRV